MIKYFNKIINYWQTVLFFTLVGAMMMFIFSSLRPAQYVAETEILVVSDSLKTINYNYSNNLGSTLVRVILSESFYNDIQKYTGKTFADENLKARYNKNNNIVNIKIYGKSLFDVQNTLENISKTLIVEADKYYSPQSNIRIKILTSAKIIRTPKIILENTVRGFLGGFIFGGIIVLFTGLKLNLFNKRNKKKYDSIIKQRLEHELTGQSNRELNLEEERYVFKDNVIQTKRSLVDKKEKILKTQMKKKAVQDDKNNVNKKDEAKDKKEFIDDIKESVVVVDNLGSIYTEEQVKEDKREKQGHQARVIASSMMIVANSKKTPAPNNLPIFTGKFEKKQKVESREVESREVVGSGADKKDGATKNTSVVDKISVDEKNLNKQENNSVVVKGDRSSVEINNTKKPSAHDIANGFAPEEKGIEGPTTEEIKDRLNKLLRGEL